MNVLSLAMNYFFPFSVKDFSKIYIPFGNHIYPHKTDEVILC